MHNFQINNVDDLVTNPSFKNWILFKDGPEAVYWNQWIAENPDKLEWMATAKVIIQLLSANEHALSTEEIDAAAAAIHENILRQEISNSYVQEEIPVMEPIHQVDKKHNLFSFFKKYRWGIAASVLMAVTAGFFLEQKANAGKSSNAYQAFLQDTKNKSIEYRNNSDSSQLITLSDGSEVVLEKSSKLSFASSAATSKREIFLTGNAFFKVTPNASQPFIVYTQNIVTKVLGTSFWIKAMPGEKRACVTVKTGKVSVFKREDFTSNDAQSAVLKGMVLTPNQELQYDIDKEQINKELVAAPIIAKAIVHSFEYDATPATQVFKELEEAYSIPIVFNEQVLASCSLTATLSNESFYEKLGIICKIINATYEVIEGNIVINARGCK